MTSHFINHSLNLFSFLTIKSVHMREQDHHLWPRTTYYAVGDWCLSCPKALIRQWLDLSGLKPKADQIHICWRYVFPDTLQRPWGLFMGRRRHFERYLITWRLDELKYILQRGGHALRHSSVYMQDLLKHAVDTIRKANML